MAGTEVKFGGLGGALEGSEETGSVRVGRRISRRNQMIDSKHRE